MFIELLAQEDVVAKPSGPGLEMFFMIGIMILIMWVVMIRPQQKRQKELQNKISSLKKNDKVVTIGGIHGSVNHLGEDTVSLRVSEGQFMTFDKKAIATILTERKDEEEDDKKGKKAKSKKETKEIESKESKEKDSKKEEKAEGSEKSSK